MIGQMKLFVLQMKPEIATIANEVSKMDGAKKENLAQRLEIKIRADIERVDMIKLFE